MTNPVVTTTRMDIGPCQLLFGGDDLGGTLDNVVVNFKYEKAPLMADQFGKTLLDEAISGMEVTIETSITQVRAKQLLSGIFKSAIVGGTDPADYLDFKNRVPLRQLPLADELTLHPIVEDAADKNYDWTFFKAMPSEESSYTFSPSEQGKMKIVWKVYLDQTVSPARMFRYGDKTL